MDWLAPTKSRDDLHQTLDNSPTPWRNTGHYRMRSLDTNRHEDDSFILNNGDIPRSYFDEGLRFSYSFLT